MLFLFLSLPAPVPRSRPYLPRVSANTRFSSSSTTSPARFSPICPLRTSATTSASGPLVIGRTSSLWSGRIRRVFFFSVKGVSGMWSDIPAGDGDWALYGSDRLRGTEVGSGNSGQGPLWRSSQGRLEGIGCMWT